MRHAATASAAYASPPVSGMKLFRLQARATLWAHTIHVPSAVQVTLQLQPAPDAPAGAPAPTYVSVIPISCSTTLPGGTGGLGTGGLGL